MSNRLIPVLAAITMAMPVTTLAQSDRSDMPGIIHVTASASVDVLPDTVSISAGVQSNAATAQEAMVRNSDLMRGVFATLEQNGIDRREITTSYINLNPRYDYERRTDGQPRLIGYQASNQITVKTRRLEMTGPLIDAMIQAGVNNINGVSFSVSEVEAAQASALDAAIQKAKAKAHRMAQAADVNLGRLLSLKEGNSPGPIAYDTMVMERASAMSAAPPVAPGEREISSTVTLSYAILD